MPYRHAHYWLLALFPLILLAFWPGYFGHYRHARLPEHAHGMTAMAWLALLTWQSWSVHAKRVAWHRAAGLAVFLAVPLFVAGGLLAIRDMAVQAAQGDPFNAHLGASLAVDDLFAVSALTGFAAAALATRRRVRRHAGWMLATAILVLPPVMARLIPWLPGFPWVTAPGFMPDYFAARLLVSLGAAILSRRLGRDGLPFAAVAALGLAQAASFAVLNGSAGWHAAFLRCADVPPLLLAATGAAAALAALVAGWRRPAPRPPRAVQPAALLRA